MSLKLKAFSLFYIFSLLIGFFGPSRAYPMSLINCLSQSSKSLHEQTNLSLYIKGLSQKKIKAKDLELQKKAVKNLDDFEALKVEVRKLLKRNQVDLSSLSLQFLAGIEDQFSDVEERKRVIKLFNALLGNQENKSLQEFSKLGKTYVDLLHRQETKRDHSELYSIFQVIAEMKWLENHLRDLLRFKFRGNLAKELLYKAQSQLSLIRRFTFKNSQTFDKMIGTLNLNLRMAMGLSPYTTLEKVAPTLYQRTLELKKMLLNTADKPARKYATDSERIIKKHLIDSGFREEELMHQNSNRLPILKASQLDHTKIMNAASNCQQYVGKMGITTHDLRLSKSEKLPLHQNVINCLEHFGGSLGNATVGAGLMTLISGLAMFYHGVLAQDLGAKQIASCLKSGLVDGFYGLKDSIEVMHSPMAMACLNPNAQTRVSCEAAGQLLGTGLNAYMLTAYGHELLNLTTIGRKPHQGISFLLGKAKELRGSRLSQLTSKSSALTFKPRQNSSGPSLLTQEQSSPSLHGPVSSSDNGLGIDLSRPSHPTQPYDPFSGDGKFVPPRSWNVDNFTPGTFELDPYRPPRTGYASPHASLEQTLTLPSGHRPLNTQAPGTILLEAPKVKPPITRPKATPPTAHKTLSGVHLTPPHKDQPPVGLPNMSPNPSFPFKIVQIRLASGQLRMAMYFFATNTYVFSTSSDESREFSIIDSGSHSAPKSGHRSLNRRIEELRASLGNGEQGGTPGSGTSGEDEEVTNPETSPESHWDHSFLREIDPTLPIEQLKARIPLLAKKVYAVVAPIIFLAAGEKGSHNPLLSKIAWAYTQEILRYWGDHGLPTFMNLPSFEQSTVYLAWWLEKNLKIIKRRVFLRGKDPLFKTTQTTIGRGHYLADTYYVNIGGDAYLELNMLRVRGQTPDGSKVSNTSPKVSSAKPEDIDALFGLFFPNEKIPHPSIAEPNQVVSDPLASSANANADAPSQNERLLLRINDVFEKHIDKIDQNEEVQNILGNLETLTRSTSDPEQLAVLEQLLERVESLLKNDSTDFPTPKRLKGIFLDLSQLEEKMRNSFAGHPEILKSALRLWHQLMTYLLKKYKDNVPENISSKQLGKFINKFSDMNKFKGVVLALVSDFVSFLETLKREREGGNPHHSDPYYRFDDYLTPSAKKDLRKHRDPKIVVTTTKFMEQVIKDPLGQGHLIKRGLPEDDKNALGKSTLKTLRKRNLKKIYRLVWVVDENNKPIFICFFTKSGYNSEEYFNKTILERLRNVINDHQ